VKSQEIEITVASITWYE